MDKIIDAWYDECSGISTVILGTKWGTFTETVVVDPDDGDVANKWDGCKFAHYKCMIDKLKAKGTAFIERANGIDHAATVVAKSMYENGYSRVKNPKEFNAVLTKFRIQSRCARRDGRKYLDAAQKMKDRYPQFVEETLNDRRKFKEKNENRS